MAGFAVSTEVNSNNAGTKVRIRGPPESVWASA